MIERHEKQYLASASARSDAKDKKKDQGAKQSSSESGGSPKETDSEGKGSTNGSSQVNSTSGSGSFHGNGSSQGRSQRSGRTCFFCGEVGHIRGIVQRKGGKQQVEMMGEIHWLRLMQGKQRSRVIHWLVSRTHSWKTL